MHQEIKQQNPEPVKKADLQRHEILELSDMDCRTIMLTKFVEIHLELKIFIKELDTIKSDTESFSPNIRNKKRILVLITPIYHCNGSSSKRN